MNIHPDHHEFAAAMINHFSTGGHPQAHKGNLDQFTPDYIQKIMAKAHGSDKVSEKYKKIAGTYMKKNMNEGPEWGHESAAKYKAETPGQEGASNIPYKSEDNVVNDDIKKMIAIVSNRIMGIKESVQRWATNWDVIEYYLEAHGTEGIDKLVERCQELDARVGKPLSEMMRPNPDELMESKKKDIQEKFLKKLVKNIKRAAHVWGNAHDPKTEGSQPKAMMKRVRDSDDKFLAHLASDKNKVGKGGPAEFQKKLAHRELKRRAKKND